MKRNLEMQPSSIAAGPVVRGSDSSALQPDVRRAEFAVLDERLALVIGVCRRLSAVRQVIPNGEPSHAVKAPVVSWPRGGGEADPSSAFAALVPVPERGRGGLKSVVLDCAHGPVTCELARQPLRSETAFKTIAELAGSQAEFITVVDGLVEALIGAGSALGLAHAVNLIRLAVQVSGFIEVIGQCDDGTLFVQGWSSQLGSGTTRMLVVGKAPAIAELKCGTYVREDLADEGRGLMGVIEAADGIGDVDQLRELFFRGANGWSCLKIYDQRILLEPVAVPGQARSVLPRVSAGEDVLERLRMTAYRFDGTDTVSSFDRPVRIGIDFAAIVDSGGMLVAGWLLDPEGLVAEVRLRVGRQGASLSANWTRSARPDVSSAFGADPLFAAFAPRHHRHGFLGFASGLEEVSSGAPCYLEVILNGQQWPRYFPLHPIRSSIRDLVQRLLPTLAHSSSSATGAIERQLGPMVKNSRRAKPSALDVFDVGSFDENHPVALVIGVDDCPCDLGVLLALLALDPEVRSVPIVLAGPFEVIDELAGDIRRLAAFYRLDVRVVLAEGVEDFCDAFEVGAGKTLSETLVFLSAHILPRGTGWLAQLLEAHRRYGRERVVSPVLLFADGSICRSGIWLDEGPAGKRLIDHYVGFPAAGLLAAEPANVMAGAVECCILERAAFQASAGFSLDYVGTTAKGLDLSLRLKVSGIGSVWLPQLQMLFGDETSSERVAWTRLVERIDAWAFESRWSVAISGMRV